MSYLNDNSSRPLLSVIIPVYNGERFLAEAIHNVQQQYQPLEIIVVDDGSTDKTADIAAQFHDQIRYVHQANQGPAVARNQGIKLAQGELITFLDVDDLWAEQVLPDFIEYLVAHPEVEIVQGLIQQMQLETAGQPIFEPVFEPVFEPYQFINLGSAIYRRSLFDKVGLLDEALRDNEDTDWFLRAWEKNVSKAVLPRVMLFYRKHDRNMTLEQKNLIHFGMMKIYKRHIDRLRDRTAQNLAMPSPSVSWQSFLGNPPSQKAPD